MNNLIITQAKKEDLPAILDVQKKAFLQVARIFHLKTMPQIEQTLESITDEFDKWIFLNASLIDLQSNKSAVINEQAPHYKLQSSRELDSRFRGNDTRRMPSENDTCAKIVGSVRAYSKDGTCYIHRLVVLPEHQNKGIGKALMAEVEKRFRSQVTRYELFTGSRDLRNLYFYPKLGYKIFKTQKHNDEISFVYLQKSV
ncbi:MAG: GNAT family N-acetyltransferase [Syntrophaceae bacterium]|nr:GNAT family N-acetyltransferase [Syntrophaceae bacterium]